MAHLAGLLVQGFACARGGGATVHARIEFGPLGRAQVRARSVEQALAMLLEGARA